MKKNLIVLDIICYGVIPFVLWQYGRGYLGDYWAIILSTVPGLIYTVYRFVKEKQFNILGLFIIGTLGIDTAVNLLSSSAASMLWNQVYLSIGYGGLFLLSIFTCQPLGLYFMADWAYLQGYARKDSIALYRRKELYAGFLWLTALFALRIFFQAGIKAWLLHTYGPESYGQVIIYVNLSNWVLTAAISIGFIVMIAKISKVTTKLYGSAS